METFKTWVQEKQCGFYSGCGTIEQTFTIAELLERWQEFVCLVCIGTRFTSLSPGDFVAGVLCENALNKDLVLVPKARAIAAFSP